MQFSTPAIVQTIRAPCKILARNRGVRSVSAWAGPSGLGKAGSPMELPVRSPRLPVLNF